MTDADIEALIRACYQDPTGTDQLTELDRVFRPYMMAILVAWDRDLAEDAYQTAFIRFIGLFRAGAQPRTNYVGYFVAIARNCLIDEMRRRQRQLPLIDELLAPTGAPAYDEASRVTDRIALLEALDALDDRCRFALTAYYIRDMPAAEIASRLRVGVDSVYVVIKRCRDRLGSELGR